MKLIVRYIGIHVGMINVLSHELCQAYIDITVSSNHLSISITIYIFVYTQQIYIYMHIYKYGGMRHFFVFYKVWPSSDRFGHWVNYR